MAQGAIQQRAPFGPQGDALITACRLNEAEPLKEALTRRTDADLAFIVPDDLYQDVIRHNFGSLRSAYFTQVKISVKEYHGVAWMHLPTSGPVQDAADAAAASMWRTTAAGALVAGLAIFAAKFPDPAIAASASHPDAVAGHSDHGWDHAHDMAAWTDMPYGHPPGHPDHANPGDYHHDYALSNHDWRPDHHGPHAGGVHLPADPNWPADGDDGGGHVQGSDSGADGLTE
jgi:hypothetical protein